MTDQYFLDRFARREAKLRVSDADRERAAERLRTGHADGRLDLAEFQERLDRCYDSKTVGELAELVSDLPRPQEPRRRRLLAWARPSYVPRLVPLLIALLVLSAATGHHVFWLWVPLMFLFWRMSWWPRRRRRRRWEEIV
jgi:Domain of unknown function (DUF1707)